MSKHIFSWDAFSDTLVSAISEELGYEPAREGLSPRAWLCLRARCPADRFVQKTKKTLERMWLPEYSGTKDIVDRLLAWEIGPLGHPVTQAEYVKYVQKCHNTKTVRLILRKALIRFGSGLGNLGPLNSTQFAQLVPARQPVDTRHPHPYQKEAWDLMSAAQAKADATGFLRGLVVMPTGSGKTFTAVRWLTENVLNQGGKVLWIAHRHELLEQVSEAFSSAAGLACNLKHLRIRTVSGQHSPMARINTADHVLICSVHSLARRPDIAALHIRERFVVIDEAHHAPAKSYKDLIDRLEGKGMVLGLTATPTRTAEAERPVLSRLFKRNIVYEVPVRKLIEQGYLARPIPVRVGTKTEVEEGVTQRDVAFLERFNDLSEAWLDRIAKIANRNRAIVQHYLANRERYGKTLIFAINVPHAHLLTQELRDAGIEADYVASYRLGETSDQPCNADLIKTFRDPAGLDVLVNVQILTEGVDVPNIQTVFLTRPTMSEILLRQMIGRALRGPCAGGTSDAYIVSFEDHWHQFRDWESPFDLVPDILQEAKPEHKTPHNRLLEVLPWDLIQAAASVFRQRLSDSPAEVFEAVPHGWYVLERDNGDDPIRQIVPLYSHQLSCWRALISHLSGLTERQLLRVTIGMLFEEYFGDCDDPQPSDHFVGMMLEHFRACGAEPVYEGFSARKECDPLEIAAELWDRNLCEREKDVLIRQRWDDNALARTVYPSLREFDFAVQHALFDLRHPTESGKTVRAVPIFEAPADRRLKEGPHHDLVNAQAKPPIIINRSSFYMNTYAIIGWNALPIRMSTILSVASFMIAAAAGQDKLEPVISPLPEPPKLNLARPETVQKTAV